MIDERELILKHKKAPGIKHAITQIQGNLASTADYKFAWQENGVITLSSNVFRIFYGENLLYPKNLILSGTSEYELFLVNMDDYNQKQEIFWQRNFYGAPDAQRTLGIYDDGTKFYAFGVNITYSFIYDRIIHRGQIVELRDYLATNVLTDGQNRWRGNGETFTGDLNAGVATCDIRASRYYNFVNLAGIGGALDGQNIIGAFTPYFAADPNADNYVNGWILNYYIPVFDGSTLTERLLFSRNEPNIKWGTTWDGVYFRPYVKNNELYLIMLEELHYYDQLDNYVREFNLRLFKYNNLTDSFDIIDSKTNNFVFAAGSLRPAIFVKDKLYAIIRYYSGGWKDAIYEYDTGNFTENYYDYSPAFTVWGDANFYLTEPLILNGNYYYDENKEIIFKVNNNYFVYDTIGHVATAKTDFNLVDFRYIADVNYYIKDVDYKTVYEANFVDPKAGPVLQYDLPEIGTELFSQSLGAAENNTQTTLNWEVPYNFDYDYIIVEADISWENTGTTGSSFNRGYAIINWEGRSKYLLFEKPENKKFTFLIPMMKNYNFNSALTKRYNFNISSITLGQGTFYVNGQWEVYNILLTLRAGYPQKAEVGVVK